MQEQNKQKILLIQVTVQGKKTTTTTLLLEFKEALKTIWVFLKLSSVVPINVSVLAGSGSYYLFLPTCLGPLECELYPPFKYQEGDTCFSLPKEGGIICLINWVGI